MKCEVILSVTDGSDMAMFRRGFFANVPLPEVERRLLADFSNEGDVWRICRQECTIDELIEELRRIRGIGYMMDNGVWHRCSVVENGFVVWEEIETL